MEHSPARELRNRVKQSPSSSPTRTQVRCSPNSSPSQTNKCQTNGVSKGKIPAINVVTFDQDIVSPGDLQSNPIVILSSEGDCHGNQSHSKIDTTTVHSKKMMHCALEIQLCFLKQIFLLAILQWIHLLRVDLYRINNGLIH